MIETEEEAELKELREQIAKTTIELMRLVGERNSLASKAGKLKSRAALPIDNEQVEDSLVSAVMAECSRVGVSRSAGLKILNTLLSESKRVQGGAAGKGVESPMGAFAKAKEMERLGKKLIRLDVGEPDFKPPRAVVEACCDALLSSKTRYTMPRGIPELTSALQGYLKRKSGYDANEDEVIVTTGGRFAIYSAIAAVVGEGESAIVIDPNWPAYKDTLRQIGAKPTIIRTTLEDSWAPSVEKIAEAVRPNTTAIVLSYPNNPSGKIIGSDTFNAIVDVANDHNLTVISDEAYVDYAYKDCPSVLHSKAKQFILAGTFSKSWSMTGFRVGYAVSSKHVVDKMLDMTSLMLTSVPEFIQYGAIKALESEAVVETNSRTMKERIEAVSKELDGLDTLEYIKPDGAMYIFPRAKQQGFSASAFATKLLEEKSVNVTPGTAFGEYQNSFRVSLGQPKEVLLEGVRRIGALLG
ncbi:MAG: aminotransferase class I/II-fold pyridoxal phosphate-dependent enzyme [Thaumarchaeota archaeon]|nr:aminotransferase class I/II-fold pyridoxal phosphate-dependent enzyme [Nitrososphaerota archaeon]